jgi:hypothetical protein
LTPNQQSINFQFFSTSAFLQVIGKLAFHVQEMCYSCYGNANGFFISTVNSVNSQIADFFLDWPSKENIVEAIDDYLLPFIF